jgi:hypothetical protein
VQMPASSILYQIAMPRNSWRLLDAAAVERVPELPGRLGISELAPGKG